MNINRVAEILKQIGVEIQPTLARNVYISCPLAPWTHPNRKDKSGGFSISVNPGDRSPCKCYNTTCKFKGTLRSLLQELTRYTGVVYDYSNFDSGLEHLLEESFSPPAESVDLSFMEHLIPLGFNYRFLTVEAGLKYDVRFHTKHRRICFMVRDVAGEVIGAVGRATNQTTYHFPDKRYFNYGHFFAIKHFYGEHVKTSDTVVIVEGPMDRLAVLESGTPYDCYALMGSAPNKSHRDIILERGYSKVILLLDNDQAGLAAKAKCVELLCDNTELFVPSYDLTEQDPGATPPKELREKLEELAPVIANRFEFLCTLHTDDNHDGLDALLR